MKIKLTFGRKLMRTYMKIKVKSKDLVKVLDDQKVINKDIIAIHKVLSDADKKHKKLQYKVQRLKDKGSKVLDTVLQEQHEMGELDFSTTMEVIDKEVVEIDIINQFDQAFSDPDAQKAAMVNERNKKISIWAEPKMFNGHKKK